MTAKAPLVAHVVHRLDVGGLENGLVNLLNRMRKDVFRHAVVCLEESTDFRDRIRRTEVRVFEMRKQRGRTRKLQLDLYRLFRNEKPDIVHTRNLPCLDALLPAAAARVPVRIHSEHGRNINDIDGTNRKHQLLRRLHRPLVTHYVTVSDDLRNYLNERVGVPETRITRIYNGVDSAKFHPRTGDRPAPATGKGETEPIVIGSVLRFDPVKDPLSIIEGFRLIARRRPDLQGRLQLAIIGDGPLWEEAKRRVHDLGLDELCYLPGSRDDVPERLRDMDIFVLPSLIEGISNTLLEAMATALPVIATRVGGNKELVVDGQTGCLVAQGEPQALSLAIESYVDDADLRKRCGRSGRARVERDFGLDQMVTKYETTYSLALRKKTKYGRGQRQP